MERKVTSVGVEAFFIHLLVMLLVMVPYFLAIPFLMAPLFGVWSWSFMTHVFIATTLICNLQIVYWKASLASPGYAAIDWTPSLDQLEENRKRYCKLCQVWKPPRAHHCKICGKCILKLDHHCTAFFFFAVDIISFSQIAFARPMVE